MILLIKKKNIILAEQIFGEHLREEGSLDDNFRGGGGGNTYFLFTK